MTTRCPNCDKPVPARKDNPTFPFCSTRCRQVDLGRWLGEEYRVPTQTTEPDEDGNPPEPSPQDPHAD
jgi:endogenous inhibitor of DNA gyrase (YacG/DUF329 family)